MSGYLLDYNDVSEFVRDSPDTPVRSFLPEQSEL